MVQNSESCPQVTRLSRLTIVSYLASCSKPTNSLAALQTGGEDFKSCRNDVLRQSGSR